MLIDWFTVLAQAVNFLILVWLLKRFLYQPILKAIDAREKRIATELADADAKRAEARVERDEFTRKNEEFDQQREGLFSKAAEEAAAERQRLFDAARRDAENLRAKQQESLQREYQRLNEEIARRTRTEVFAIARKTLKELAGADLEERMVDTFVRRLREPDVAAMAQGPTSSQATSAAVVVRSAFETNATQRTLIENTLKDKLSPAAVRFEVAPELIGGIELIAYGQKIAWSVADQLDALERDVDALLKAQQKAETRSR
jgi:F-type H+-transporting ATPase subunit b